jgi:flagellin
MANSLDAEQQPKGNIMLSVNSNVPALFAANALNDISNRIQDLTTHIAAGKRILTAADDPAGMGQLSLLKAQFASFNAVTKNLTAGQNLLSTAAASLSAQQGIMTKMKDLATQASSDLLSANDRTALQASFTQLQKQLDDTVNKASLFGQNLTSSTAANVNIQSGINSGDTTTINAAKSDATTLAIGATIDLSTSAKAAAAMTAIDTAVGTVSTNQATIGAQQNLLKDAASYISTVSANTKSAISNIEDLNIAEASSQLTLLQTQQQLATSVLGIINQLPAYALSLIK